MRVVHSKRGVPIRLTTERWSHIVENHDDLAGYRDDVLTAIEEPDEVLQGKTNELIALKSVPARTLVVVYRETSSNDGFVITAFFTTELERVRKRGLVWPRR